jgi:hypothetical protein
MLVTVSGGTLIQPVDSLSLVVLQNRWRKRGLAVTPTKFGIAFTKLTYNQGGALVHVYTDGTVRPGVHRHHLATCLIKRFHKTVGLGR